jgi:hypothetical protein
LAVCQQVKRFNDHQILRTSILIAANILAEQLSRTPSATRYAIINNLFANKP